MTSHKRRKSSSSRYFTITVLFILVAAGVGGFILFFEGEKPSIDLSETRPFLGKNGVVDYKITDTKSGIRNIKVIGTQGTLNKEIFTTSFPRTSYQGSVGPGEVVKSLSFNAKKEGFADGKMTLTVQAQDFSFRGWFKGNSTTVSKEVTIDTVPPRVQILHSEKYISQGGSGIAIYRLSDQKCRHGVEINDVFHHGFLIGDGRKDTYISYFAMPYDAVSIDQANIKATDMAGNTAMIPFTPVFKKANQKKDTINVGDGFLNRKIPEFQQYYPEMRGENIDKYLFANKKVREQNNTQISNLCSSPEGNRLWKGVFNRMPGASRAGYADHRTYYYNQKAVDHQVHLGMDIASTRKADVRAANSGKVVYSGYLGIYGNMVLLDHGQGVFSLYSHLSQINVQPEDLVNKKSVIGLTGTTGMAGGDHLHFSMLINGIFVTPKEWWDLHWIEVTIEEPITSSKF